MSDEYSYRFDRDYAPFIAAAEKAGHVLRLSDDGDIDAFVCDSGFHNGPGCTRCLKSWCWHCTSADKVAQTPCLSDQALVDLDREADDAVLRAAEAIQKKRASLSKARGEA